MIAQALGFCSSALTTRTAACASSANRATKRSTCAWVSQTRLVPTSKSQAFAGAQNSEASSARRVTKLIRASCHQRSIHARQLQGGAEARFIAHESIDGAAVSKCSSTLPEPLRCAGHGEGLLRACAQRRASKG